MKRPPFTPKLVLLDFSDMENISDVVSEICECYGCVDVLICNSSMKVKAPVQNLSLEMDKTIMDVNYFGPITLAKDVCSKLNTHGVSPQILAQEIVRSVNRQSREVFLAHPVPTVALYIRALMPGCFFSVVSAGVRDGAMAEQL